MRRREHAGDSKESHKEHLTKALEAGSYHWPPHAYEVLETDFGTFVLYYIQGMFMSLWHRESSLVRHTPLLWAQDEKQYQKHQIKFERSVRALERK